VTPAVVDRCGSRTVRDVTRISPPIRPRYSLSPGVTDPVVARRPAFVRTVRSVACRPRSVVRTYSNRSRVTGLVIVGVRTIRRRQTECYPSARTVVQWFREVAETGTQSLRCRLRSGTSRLPGLCSSYLSGRPASRQTTEYMDFESVLRLGLGLCLLVALGASANTLAARTRRLVVERTATTAARATRSPTTAAMT